MRILASLLNSGLLIFVAAGLMEVLRPWPTFVRVSAFTTLIIAAPTASLLALWWPRGRRAAD